jgi:hypothetical protein
MALPFCFFLPWLSRTMVGFLFNPPSKKFNRSTLREILDSLNCRPSFPGAVGKIQRISSAKDYELFRETD